VATRLGNGAIQPVDQPILRALCAARATRRGWRRRRSSAGHGQCSETGATLEEWAGRLLWGEALDTQGRPFVWFEDEAEEKAATPWLVSRLWSSGLTRARAWRDRTSTRPSAGCSPCRPAACT